MTAGAAGPVITDPADRAPGVRRPAFDGAGGDAAGIFSAGGDAGWAAGVTAIGGAGAVASGGAAPEAGSRGAADCADGSCSCRSRAPNHAQPPMAAATTTAATAAAARSGRRGFPDIIGPCTVKRSGTCPGGRCRSDFFSASRMYDICQRLGAMSAGVPGSGSESSDSSTTGPAIPSTVRLRERW